MATPKELDGLKSDLRCYLLVAFRAMVLSQIAISGPKALAAAGEEHDDQRMTHPLGSGRWP